MPTDERPKACSRSDVPTLASGPFVVDHLLDSSLEESFLARDPLSSLVSEPAPSRRTEAGRTRDVMA